MELFGIDHTLFKLLPIAMRLAHCWTYLGDKKIFFYLYAFIYTPVKISKPALLRNAPGTYQKLKQMYHSNLKLQRYN